MRTGTGKLLALAVAGLLVLPRIVAALDLYTHDFNADPVGTVTRPNDTYLYQFHGDTGVTLVEEVTAADGVGGTPSYRQTITATGAPRTSIPASASLRSTLRTCRPDQTRAIRRCTASRRM